MLQCTGEGGADEDGGIGSSSVVSSIWTSHLPVAMTVISFFYSGVNSSQRALACEEVIMRVVRRGERDRRQMTPAMVGVVVYIAMLGGKGTDGWRWRSRIVNRVSLMWAAGEQTNGHHVV